ncbi:MAG: hypothetical protein Q9185_006057 [Variospora sp. 1 TL-2023]
MINVEQALEKIIGQLDSMVEEDEKDFLGTDSAVEETIQLTEVFAGVPEKVEAEIVFCDADNINTDGIHPGNCTYHDDITTKKMAEVCMSNYDDAFPPIARQGDPLSAGFKFGCGSSREQAATTISAKKIPLVVAGSFCNIFSRDSINNALMGVEVSNLVRLPRESFSEVQLGESQQHITGSSRK